MNFNFYIFGNPSDEYEQYPSDYSVEIIKPRIANLVNERFVIHRENDIMYYMFAVKFNDTQYIGYCFVINGLSISNIQTMLTIFEKITTLSYLKSYAILDDECKYVVEHFFHNIDGYRSLDDIFVYQFKSLNVNSLDNINTFRKDKIVFALRESDDKVNQSLNDYVTIILDDAYREDNALTKNTDNSLKRFAIIILPLAMVSMAYNLFVLNFDIRKLETQNQSLYAKIDSINNNPYKFVDTTHQLPFNVLDIELKDLKGTYKKVYSKTDAIIGVIYYYSTTQQDTVNLTIKIRKDSIVDIVPQTVKICAFDFLKFKTVNFDTARIEIVGHRWMNTGQWDSGNYRYEVWGDKQCLGVEQFTIK